jgi:DtxR family Mn-dependent transcriptional regulator
LGSFLVDKLDFSWDEVHDIAEQLEHIKSEKLINKLDDFLGNPTEDPHGVYSDANGQIVKIEKQLLSECTKPSRNLCWLRHIIRIFKIFRQTRHRLGF